MFRVLVLGALLSLCLWVGAVGTGVAVAVMSQGNTYEISLLVILANVMAPLLGGFAAGWMVKKRGWVHGGWVGVLYSLAAAFLAALFFPGLFILSPVSLMVNFSLGCIGGICGVNSRLFFAGNKERESKTIGL